MGPWQEREKQAPPHLRPNPHTYLHQRTHLHPYTPLRTDLARCWKRRRQQLQVQAKRQQQ